MIAALHQGQDAGGDRIHSGGKEQSRVCALKFRDCSLDSSVCGIAVARIKHVAAGCAQLLVRGRDLES